MFRVSFQYDEDENRDECISSFFHLQMPDEAEYHFAAIENANEFISRGFVMVDLQEL